MPHEAFKQPETRQLGLGLTPPPAPLEQIGAAFRQQMEEVRSREVGAALTLVGPHRDDLRFTIDGVDMTTYASRGQGRTIAVSLKLAEIELMRAETGEEPLLLLDDVMSELDKPRRAALSQAIQNATQAIVSATDLDDFTPEFIAASTVLNVSEGKILVPEMAEPNLPEDFSPAEIEMPATVDVMEAPPEQEADVPF